MSTQVKLPVDVVNRVLSFLATRPYTEVAELISEVQSAAVVDDSKEGEESE